MQSDVTRLDFVYWNGPERGSCNYMGINEQEAPERLANNISNGSPLSQLLTPSLANNSTIKTPYDSSPSVDVDSGDRICAAAGAGISDVVGSFIVAAASYDGVASPG